MMLDAPYAPPTSPITWSPWQAHALLAQHHLQLPNLLHLQLPCQHHPLLQHPLQSLRLLAAPQGHILPRGQSPASSADWELILTTLQAQAAHNALLGPIPTRAVQALAFYAAQAATRTAQERQTALNVMQASFLLLKEEVHSATLATLATFLQLQGLHSALPVLQATTLPRMPAQHAWLAQLAATRTAQERRTAWHVMQAASLHLHHLPRAPPVLLETLPVEMAAQPAQHACLATLPTSAGAHSA